MEISFHYPPSSKALPSAGRRKENGSNHFLEPFLEGPREIASALPVPHRLCHTAPRCWAAKNPQFLLRIRNSRCEVIRKLLRSFAKRELRYETGKQFESTGPLGE